jgi:hypothetical protein
MLRRYKNISSHSVHISVIGFWLALFLTSPNLARATVLSDLAASMQPGTWAQLTGSNAGLLSQQWAPSYGHGYDDGNMAWNSKKRMILHATAEHGPYANCNSFPNPPGTCWKALMTYTESTNTWTVGGPIPTQVIGWHGYDNVAWDDANEVLYIHEFGSGEFYRYCVNNTPSWCSGKQGTWSLIASSPAPLMPNCCNIGSIAYHDTMDGGSLLFFNGDTFGPTHGGLLQYRESTGTWTMLAGSGGAFTNGDYSNVIECSPVKQVCIFGGGGSSRNIWKITANKTITQMPAAPFPVTFGATYTRQALADPVTGDFIFIFGYSSTGTLTTTAELWKLNPDGSGQWTQLDSNLKAAGKPCNTDFIKPCPNDFFGTAISTYGVLLFWKYTGSTTAEVWLYKPSGSSPPPPPGPDTTSPTVSITVPTAGSTVSGNFVVSATATDNLGVVGVQFKLDGNNLGAEDTSSPFSVSWDTTVIANGSHTLTAIARDVAGNSITSTPITVTVSNSVSPPLVGSSEFQTRCAQPGVIRCVGFDQASDISNTQWGANTGIDVGGASVPILDSSIKASGNSSLKFTIPSNSGANTSGSYWANFSTDLSTQFGENSDFYVQWRQRFSPEFLTTIYQGGGGWKQAIIGTGDKPGCTVSNTTNCYASCTALEVVTQNTYQRGFAQMYNSCTGSTSHGAYDGFYQPFGSYDFKLQNARPSPYCLYSQSGANHFPPNGNCFGHFPDEWMTFQVRIKTGPRVGNEFTNSYVELWIAREGKPSEQALNWGPYNLSAGSSGDNQRFGKVWLLPYNTGKSSSQSHPTAYTWFDELIISSTRIPDPGGSTVASPAAPTNLTLQ